MIESVRLGNRAKNQLVTLKRKTGIQNWNVLCRWAFVMSLREPSRPRQLNEGLDGGVEMTWRTFAGDYADIFEALLKKRYIEENDTLVLTDLGAMLRQHIYRGIGYMAAGSKVNNIADLAKLAVSDKSSNQSI